MASFKDIKFYLLLLSGIAISVIGIYLFFASSIAGSLFDLSKVSYTPDIYQKLFSNSSTKQATVATSTGKYNVALAVANNDTTRQKGLMGVKSLGNDQGMLFVFTDSPSIRTFWMKDTLISLDMIFLDQNKNVVYIQHAAVPCSADPCPIFSSQFPAEYVIELNGGWSSTHNLLPGDNVNF